MSLLQTTLTSLFTVIGDTGGCDGRVQPAGAALSDLATDAEQTSGIYISTTQTTNTGKITVFNPINGLNLFELRDFIGFRASLEDILNSYRP